MKMIRLAIVLTSVWFSVLVQIAFFPTQGGFISLLQPALWTIFLISLRLGPGQTLALSVLAGLLLDYWSVLPFGITLTSIVVAAGISRTISLGWFSHRLFLTGLSAVFSGQLIFFLSRDLLGLAAKIFGADTGWVIEPRALIIQSTALFYNLLVILLAGILSMMFKQTIRKLIYAR